MLDNRTRAAIRKLNELDTSLYELARRVGVAQLRCLDRTALGGEGEAAVGAAGSKALIECLREARARSRNTTGHGRSTEVRASELRARAR